LLKLESEPCQFGAGIAAAEVTAAGRAVFAVLVPVGCVRLNMAAVLAKNVTISE
jgi:hypothetical protein